MRGGGTMQNMKEALQVRAELALWRGRKAVHQPRLESLQSKYILEQDDVNRLQRGIFSKLKRDYEEKLEKEKAEVASTEVLLVQQRLLHPLILVDISKS